MWFGVEDGVECGRSTGLCPLPLGAPQCVIHDKKNVGTKFLVILKKNNINHQNHSNNAKKQKNFQMTKHLHRDLSTTNQKNRPFGLEKSEALKRELFLKYIKSITPYKVQYRIVVLLVTTTSNEAYYVLMNANQKHHEKAYWLSAILGWWTDAIDNKDYYKNNDLLGLFHIPDASMFYLEPYGYGEDDLDAYLSYKEMEEVLAGEGNVIRYGIDSI